MGGVLRGDQARQLDGLHFDVPESGAPQVLLDKCRVGVAEGAPLHVARILRKEGRDCLARRLRNGIEVEAVEGRKHVPTSGAEDAACLRVRSDLVWKEHDPEEAENEVEALGGEGSCCASAAWKVTRC